MKRQTHFRILAAAVATMAPLAFAQAEEINFISTAASGHFQAMAAMPKTNADEQLMQGRHVTLTPLGWEIVTYDNPRAGAFGPLREDFNPEATLARNAEERLWDQMSPIGGRDTP